MKSDFDLKLLSKAPSGVAVMIWKDGLPSSLKRYKMHTDRRGSRWSVGEVGNCYTSMNEEDIIALSRATHYTLWPKTQEIFIPPNPWDDYMGEDSGDDPQDYREGFYYTDNSCACVVIELKPKDAGQEKMEKALRDYLNHLYPK